jgi:hypothetical protein
MLLRLITGNGARLPGLSDEGFDEYVVLFYNGCV